MYRMTQLYPLLMSPAFDPRPWGTLDLSPIYPNQKFNEKIGEAWLTGDACQVTNGPLAKRSLSDLSKEFGPALVGSVTIMQLNSTDATFVFAGQCRGNAANFSMTLSPFNVSTTTAASLEGLSLPGKGPAGCLSQAGGENVTVVTVVTPEFVNTQTGLVNAAKVVILYVVP